MNDFTEKLWEFAQAMPPVNAAQSIRNPHEKLDTRKEKIDYIAKLSGNGSNDLRVKDAKPLHAGVLKVFNIMNDNEWHTIPELRERTGLGCADRAMRKLRSYGYTIDKRRIGDSRAFEYRMKFDSLV